MVAIGRLADSVDPAPLTVHGDRPIRLSSTAVFIMARSSR
jgi:hypothetical protein